MLLQTLSVGHLISGLGTRNAWEISKAYNIEETPIRRTVDFVPVSVYPEQIGPKKGAERRTSQNLPPVAQVALSPNAQPVGLSCMQSGTHTSCSMSDVWSGVTFYTNVLFL